MKTEYTLIIIGAGSAGYPAGMYASRYAIDNLIIGKEPGWALATSHCVENFPGEKSINGKELMNRFEDHSKHSGSDILQDTVNKIIENTDKTFTVKTTNHEFQAQYILLATGNSYRKLGVPGEQELLGSGVSYCATCDGNFFKGKEIAMVGWGDAAFVESLYLAEIVDHVHLLVRWPRARAETTWVEKVKNTDNITIHYETEVGKIEGKFMVENLKLKNGKNLKVSGIFIAVGSNPSTELLENFNLKKDDSGCILVDKRQQSSYPKIYAAGDVTTNSNKFKQTIMSAAEWCLAANSIHEDILNNS